MEVPSLLDNSSSMYPTNFSPSTPRHDLQQIQHEIYLLSLLISYPTPLKAFHHLLYAHNQLLQEYYHITTIDLNTARLALNKNTTLSLLFHLPPLSITAIAYARRDQITLLRLLTRALRHRQISTRYYSTVLSLIGPEASGFLLLDASMRAARDTKRSQPMEIPRTVPIVKELHFSALTALGNYVGLTTPKIVYNQRRLRVADLINSVSNLENVMLILYTTNSKLVVGLFSSKKLLRDSFVPNDSKFFVFVADKKDLFIIQQKITDCETVCISALRNQPIIIVKQAMIVKLEVVNSFSGATKLICTFDNLISDAYIEKHNKSLPFKTGTQTKYEIMSISAVQWS
ncbi:TLDc domain-containing protein [Entamoeba marina]